ncbi:MAG: MBOAT family protein [Akkermansiaceae bacterium]|nr:MBOAT family protein [Akkermansiaceae bacterium]MCF7730770.1 MBOAT family protein [Akkermansiaceae bacterium]
MLFSTYTYLLFFLPLVLLGFYGLGRIHWRLSTAWLTLASLGFYAWWKPDPDLPWTPWFLLLIVGSCAGNFLCGNAIARSANPVVRRSLVTFGVATNLSLLAYFKYLGIFSVWSHAVTGWPHSIPHLVLPLAVSFFTFLQIAFLVDVFRGDKTGYNFADYLLFVTFFPHLIAGPLVHHRELIGQFQPKITRLNPRFIAIGLSVLALGLFKKVIIADNLAETASPIFQFAADGTRALTNGEAWVGALAYTFQIYFDFSGYSDMAIGSSYLFGLRLPLNFCSPYKATSIIDFWRRWHMTLSRFLRDYLYIPLGGNRRGPSRRYANLMVTMLLGGLWHGAGITFLLWGGLHGLYLCVNNAWIALRRKLGWRPLPRLLAVTITFMAVVFAWVPFRSGNYELASSGNARLAWETTTRFYHSMVVPQDGPLWTPLSKGAIMKAKRALRPLVYAIIIAFFLPNTQEFMGRFSPHFRTRGEPRGRPRRWWSWRPVPLAAVFVFILLVIVTLEIDRGGEFIYFQF